jgi:hypothetical protein
MTGNFEDQTKRTMDGIKQTFDAAGASFKDVVHMFVFRARLQMGDIGRASWVINRRNDTEVRMMFHIPGLTTSALLVAILSLSPSLAIGADDFDGVRGDTHWVG